MSAEVVPVQLASQNSLIGSPPFPTGPTNDAVLCRLFAARNLMKDQAVHRLGLNEIARHAGMSTYHFVRVFRLTFGTTPHQQAVEFRLGRAKELLVDTELPVTEICFECGYESLGSFSHLFRRSVGCSPREYRSRRRRFWSVNIRFLRSFAPFCLLDGFHVRGEIEQYSRSILPAD